MKLVLAAAEPWQLVAGTPDEYRHPEMSCRVVASSLFPRALSHRDRHEQIAREGIAADHEAIIVGHAPGTAELGWPIDVVELCVATPRPARTIVESRIFVFYGFLEWAGIAWAAGAQHVLEAHHAAIQQVLLSGRPDWRGEPATIHELYAGYIST